MTKGNHFFENLEQVLTEKGKINNYIFQILLKCRFKGLHQNSRSVYCRNQITIWMVMMKILSIKSIHESIKGEWSSLLNVGKDVLYKIKNDQLNNWRKILLFQSYKSTQGIEIEKEAGTNTSWIPCFIIDDTDLPKRGKHMEWIGKIYSHVTHGFTLGYKSLNLAYWSGKHLVHVDFSYHAEMGKKGNQGMKPNGIDTYN